MYLFDPYINRRPSTTAEMILKRKQLGESGAGAQEMYDFTGMFHWCPGKNMEDCILVRSCPFSTSDLNYRLGDIAQMPFKVRNV